MCVPLHPAERDLLRKVSPELDPEILFDTKKGLGAVVKFLDSLPQLLWWWFAWLGSLLGFYWVSISGIELLGVMYLRFPLAHVNHMENSVPSNVWIHNARLYCYLDSLIETNAFEITCLLCISSRYIILYITVWCKDDKPIFYLRDEEDTNLQNLDFEKKGSLMHQIPSRFVTAILILVGAIGPRRFGIWQHR